MYFEKNTSSPCEFFLSAVDDVGLLRVDESHRAGLEADQSRHITQLGITKGYPANRPRFSDEKLSL
jgi:hypothetical protein